MKLWRIAVLALTVSLTWVALAAEGWHRPFAVLGPEQGIPNGGIICMAQDADGFIWLGTENGLLRYEGGQCSRWTRKEGLPSDHVDRLVAIPDGGLWVSTNQGLVRFRQGRFEKARFKSPGTIPGLRATALDATGRLWVATSEGLFVQAQDLDFSLHPHSFGGQVFTVASGRAGTMHVGTDRGLRTLHPDGKSESWDATLGLPKAGVELVGEDGAGRLWACSGRLLVRKEPGAQTFSDQSRLLKAPVTPYGAFFKDSDGSLWLPTKEGALLLQGAQSSVLDASAGLPMRWVRNVFRDREGGLWILGTTLARLLGDERVWNHPLTTGPSGEIVWSMLRDLQGQLLVGTDAGVARVGASSVQWIPGTGGYRVKGLSFDRSGRLWMVGTTGPTLWLEPGGVKAVVAPLGDLGFGLNTVMTDSTGRVWIGHGRQGILRWDGARRRLVQEVGPDKAPAGILGAFRIREDAGGRLWAATSMGLYIRERSGQWRLFTEKDGILPFGLFGLAFLPDGSAWICSSEAQGLMRIRVEGEKVTVLERRRAGQGLRSDLIYAVEVDPQGRTWTTTDQGFDCLDNRIHVGRREGIISEDCDLLALLAEKDRVLVGTSAGLVRYEAGDGKPSQIAAPTPHILHVVQGNQRLEAPFDSFGPVRPGNSSLAFRVAVPSYRYQGQLRIQVRLVGLEENWRDLDAPQTRYQALPKGAYRFEARAAQPDGTFGPIVSLGFKVLPRWWLTWWAITIWGACSVGLILLIVRARVASLAQSKAELEVLVAERTEELRDRNDELTDALGRVKQLSGLLPICATCKKIRDDKGYWNQLEHYISEHSEVGFSHGICPDCVGTMYPAYAARQEARNHTKES